MTEESTYAKCRGLFACVFWAMANMPGSQNVQAADVHVTTGTFRKAAAIGTELKRGLSTKADVKLLLGTPNGHGDLASASLGIASAAVWYYEDIEITGSKAAKDAINMDMRQQILLVIFKGELFDGYLWTSNAGPAAAR